MYCRKHRDSLRRIREVIAFPVHRLRPFFDEMRDWTAREASRFRHDRSCPLSRPSSSFVGNWLCSASEIAACSCCRSLGEPHRSIVFWTCTNSLFVAFQNFAALRHRLDLPKMMRTAIFAAARNATVVAARPSAARSLSMAAMRRPAAAPAPAMAAQLQQLRFASSGALSKDDISSRILEVLKSFEKVDPAKVGASQSCDDRVWEAGTIC